MISIGYLSTFMPKFFTRALSCWNWKCAMLSATARSLVYLAAMARSGPQGRMAVVLVEMGYVTFTAGLYAGLQQKALEHTVPPGGQCNRGAGSSHAGTGAGLAYPPNCWSRGTGQSHLRSAVCYGLGVLSLVRDASRSLPDRQARTHTQGRSIRRIPRLTIRPAAAVSAGAGDGHAVGARN